MSGYIKRDNCDCRKKDRDSRKKDYERKERKYIIVDKDKAIKRECGCDPCKQQHPKARGVIEACGMQGSDIVNPSPPVEISRVIIDTSCLCNPMVTIDFCSIISFNDGPNATIRLSKECENIGKHKLAEYNFDGAQSTEAFCFKFCDTNTNCTGCCSYIVELVDGSNINSITQGVITGKAQGACGC